MNKKSSYQIIALIFLVGITFATQAQKKVSKNIVPKRPNVIFILVDDMGWKDLGVYGSSFYEMPNIDRIGCRGNAIYGCLCQQPRLFSFAVKYYDG